jgi:hypothetical protein
MGMKITFWGGGLGGAWGGAWGGLGGGAQKQDTQHGDIQNTDF